MFTELPRNANVSGLCKFVLEGFVVAVILGWLSWSHSNSTGGTGGHGTLKDQFGFAHGYSSVVLCKALVGARVPQRDAGEFKSSVGEHGDPVTWHHTSTSHPVKGNTSLAAISHFSQQANVDGG